MEDDYGGYGVNNGERDEVRKETNLSIDRELVTPSPDNWYELF